MKERINTYLSNKFAFPVILFLITLVSYGILSPWMKFFHDEYSILFFHLRLKDVSLFFEGNRPFLAYIYKPLLAVFGSNYFLWFFFGIITRWLQSYCLFLLLNHVWSDRKYFAISASMFCLFFPAFQAQFAFMMFGVLFLLFTIFLISLLASVIALEEKTRKVPLTIFALGLSFINLITSEYFFLLEILRYLIFGFVLIRENRQGWVKRVIRESLPYLALFLILTIWRFSQQSAETTYTFNGAQFLPTFSISKLIDLIKTMVRDVWKVSFGSWIYAFHPLHLLEDLSKPILVVFVGISLSIGMVSYLLLRRTTSKTSFTKAENGWVLLLSITAVIAAGLPFWIAQLPIGEYYFFSRWSIPFMVGISIFFAWLLYFGRNHRLIIIVTSILFAVGAGNQLLAANSFRHDWIKQQAYYWQFYWRIPSLAENTTIFSNYLDFDYENSDEISGALNLFQNTRDDQGIPIFQFYLPERIGTNLLPKIQPDFPLPGRRYYGSFKGNSSQSIIVDYQFPACFKVLDPEIDIFNPSIDELSKDALFLSDLSLISATYPHIDFQQIESIFGKQPIADWCYYFEKADHARQFKEWKIVRDIYTEVTAAGFLPRDQREWFPFIEGLSHLNDWDVALKLSTEAYTASPQYKEMLIQLWKRIDIQTVQSLEKEITMKAIWQLLDES